MTTAPCLVLDIGLPGLSGFELYQRLIKTGAKLPVIFITAGSERAREVGAIAYLLKPVRNENYWTRLLEPSAWAKVRGFLARRLSVCQATHSHQSTYVPSRASPRESWAPKGWPTYA
jgi:FixJ family two-component response regulator